MSRTERNRARWRKWHNRRLCRKLLTGARSLWAAFLNPKPLPEARAWRSWGGR